MNYTKGYVDNISQEGIKKRCSLEDSKEIIEGIFLETSITLKDKNGEYKCFHIKSEKDIKDISRGELVYVFHEKGKVEHIFKNKKDAEKIVNKTLDTKEIIKAFSEKENFDYSLSFENIFSTFFALIVTAGFFMGIELIIGMMFGSALLGLEEASILFSSEKVILFVFIFNIILTLYAIFPDLKKYERVKKEIESQAASMKQDIGEDFQEEIKLYQKEEA